MHVSTTQPTAHIRCSPLHKPAVWTAFSKNRVVDQTRPQTLSPHRALRLKLGFQTTKPSAANTPTSSDRRREEDVYSPSIFIISSSVFCFIVTLFMFPSLCFFPLIPCSDPPSFLFAPLRHLFLFSGSFPHTFLPSHPPLFSAAPSPTPLAHFN